MERLPPKPQLQAVETCYGGLKNSKGELIFSGQALGDPLPALQSNNNITVGDTVRIGPSRTPGYDWRKIQSGVAACR